MPRTTPAPARPSTRAPRLEHLQQLLAAPREEALELCLEEPRLLLPSVSSLAANWRELVDWLAGVLPEEWVTEDDEAAAEAAAAARRGKRDGGGGGGGGGNPRAEQQDGAAVTAGALPAAAARRAAAARTLRAWARRAPLLLARRADAMAERLGALAEELVEGAPPPLAAAAAAAARGPGAPARLLRWAARDPRVLLARPGAVQGALATDLADALNRPREFAYALAAAHPSYLVLNAGALGAWAADVEHLLQALEVDVLRLAAEPEVGRQQSEGL
jgi:hypothetical protein